jgi:hypothetical protein
MRVKLDDKKHEEKDKPRAQPAPDPQKAQKAKTRTPHSMAQTLVLSCSDHTNPVCLAL